MARKATSKAESPNDGPLTSRELDVLSLICQAYSTKEIADKLGISFKTAVSHRTRILAKVGVHDSISLFRWAIWEGIVEPPVRRSSDRKENSSVETVDAESN